MNETSEYAVSLRGLVKHYGQRTALDGLDLDVPRGSFYALLGPNGAGKTTTLRLLLGLIRPDGGQGEVLGHRFGRAYPPVELKARIGYVAERNPLYPRATGAELLHFAAALNRRWNDRLVKRYLDLFGLPLNVPVRQMSTGMRAQLGLALAMGGDPELLILDEPTHGLDPLRRHQYLQALLADTMESGRTVLLSSHDLTQVERIADRVAIIDRGRVAVARTIDELKEQEKRVRVSCDGDCRVALRQLPGVRRVTHDSLGYLLHVSGEVERLQSELARLPGLHGIQVHDQSLEEIFLSYVEEERP